MVAYDTFHFWSLADVRCDDGVETCELIDGTQRVLYTADVLTFVRGDGFHIPPSLTSFLKAVDAWAIDYITTHSERILGRPLTTLQVKDVYNPTLPNRNYIHLLRRQLEAARVLPEVDGSHCSEVRPLLHISHLWIKGGACGLACKLDALLMQHGGSSWPILGHMVWGNMLIPVESGV